MRIATELATLESLIRKCEGQAQSKPKKRNQGSEDGDYAAVRFDPFVEIGFEPKKVTDGGSYQVYRERGRGERDCKVCIEERQILGIDG